MHDGIGLEPDDPHPADGGLHLVDGGELREDPLRHLEIDQRAVTLRRIIRLVTAVLREEEEAGRKPRLVDPLGDELLLHDGQTDHPVTGAERQPRSAVGGQRLELLPARNDDIEALQRTVAPLDRPRLHVAAIGRRDRDSRAGQHLGGCKQGRKGQ